MVFKVNFQARLRRHSRIKKALWKGKFLSYFWKFKLIALLLAFILPIYPSIGVFALNRESKVWKYDETSIITAYNEEAQLDPMFSSDDWFLRAKGILESSRDLSNSNNLIHYVVRAGDSLGSIASNFNVSTNSIIWANNLDKNTVIQPGASLKIPPVSGVIYTVESGDTLEGIALKFKIPAEKIQTQNSLQTSAIEKWAQLIIPGAIMLDPPKELALINPKNSSNSSKANTKKAVVEPKKQAKISANSSASKSYRVKYTGNARGFYWGNCTYYVAMNKNVTWRWNANAWLRNAAAQWIPTGKTAAKWAIISFGWSKYNPYYGHVWIVADIDGNDLIIKDMNYRKLGEITIRRVPKDDSSIRGYIYVD
jgi:LysM repeat protein